MKIINIPEDQLKDVPVRIVNEGAIQEKKIDLPFVDFIQLSLDAYEPLGKGGKAGRQAAKLAEILESINGETHIRFEDADYEIVERAVEAMIWIPSANRRLNTYRDAVEKAQDVPTPTKK